MNKKSLPYGLEPHEIAFLGLLGVALYASSPTPGPRTWQPFVFGAAVLAAVPVLIWR